MSKRKSSNAIKFAGKNWHFGSIKGSKKTKRQEKINRKRLSRNNRRKAKLDIIKNKFNYKTNTPQNKHFYNSVLKYFISLKNMKGNQIINLSVNNVLYFKDYCEKHNKEFDFIVYFKEGFYKKNFSKTMNSTVLSNNKSTIYKNTSIINLITEEIKEKLNLI